MRTAAILFFAAVLMGAAPIAPTTIESMAQVREAARHGDSLWPGYSTAPFGFLLVSDEGEVLLCDERLPDGFTRSDRLKGLDCAVATGPKSWRNPSLLAAMPAFGPGEVIVMGSPAATGLDEEAWRRTALHEHFHQWQGQLPDIYARLEALGLSKGDQSGMWMLNYPFPYEKPEVDAAYHAAAEALLAALSASPADLRRSAEAYLAKRRAFAASVSEEEWRYFDFQLWKEGVARWTEMEVAKRAGGKWAERAERDWKALLADLSTASLAKKQRVGVYSYGAAEAALLERVDPDWRGCYRAVTTMSPCWDSLMPPAR